IGGLCVATWAYFREKASHEVAANAVALQQKSGKSSQQFLERLRELERKLAERDKQQEMGAVTTALATKLTQVLVSSASGAVSGPDRDRWRASLFEAADLIQADNKLPAAWRHEWSEMPGDAAMQ